MTCGQKAGRDLGSAQAIGQWEGAGPDGFTAQFLRSCWDIIKGDLCDAFDKLFSLNGRGFQKLNEALLTLLSKRAHPHCSTID